MDDILCKEIYDEESNSSYIKLTNEKIRITKEYKGIVCVDIGVDGKVCGIEFLGGGRLNNI